MRQYFFSQIYGAESIDVKTLPRILIIRTRFMQLGKLPNARIIDQNINFHILFPNLFLKRCYTVVGCDIQLQTSHSFFFIQLPPTLICHLLWLATGCEDLGIGIAGQEKLDQLVTDALVRACY
jgi:hypothetical protein